MQPRSQRSMLDAMGFTGVEEPSIVEALFEYKRLPRLKMTTEVAPSLVFPLACMGVIQDRYQSRVLKAFSTQFYLHEISKDRKGRLELVEALLSLRRPTEEEG